MPMACSMDLRKRVVAARDAGEPALAVARRFGVSDTWVRRLMQRRRERGSIDGKRGTPGRKPKLADHKATLHALIH